ncbi:MAG: response regulator transcription factor [Anaerolineae bacterium]|jgi:DNA-binding response OmpR family regulator
MKALVVDDDRVVADVVAFTLRREGFQVTCAFDGEQALAAWSREQPDLVVLDVNLPDISGFEVCRRIREDADTPVLLLTVRHEEDDIVRGLQLGADDYVTKPFSPRQLVARAQAVLRRAGKVPATATRTVGPLVLDPNRRVARLADGPPVSLAPLECRLLDYLMLNTGHVLTTEAIIQHVWAYEGADRDMLRQLVHRLRGKLEQLAASASSDPDAAIASPTPRIETVAGLGYGLTVDN